MDFVTHAAVGALAGRALAPALPIDPPGVLPIDAASEAPSGSSLARLGAIAALVPDADHVLEVLSAELYLQHHRTFSHSLLGVTAIALLVAAPGGAIGRGRRLAVAAAALTTHLVLDVATPFGTGLLWPFSDWRLASDGLPIVAPWLLLLAVSLAIAAALAARRSPARGRGAARAGLAALGALLIATHGLAAWGGRQVPGEPAPFAVPRWTFPAAVDALLPAEDAVVHYRVAPWAPAEVVGRVPWVADAEGRPLSRAAAGAPPAGAPLERFRFPVAAVGSDSITYWDAQFAPIAPDRRPIRIEVDRTSGGYEVHQLLRGSQLLLWAAVAAAAWLLAGRPRGEG